VRQHGLCRFPYRLKSEIFDRYFAMENPDQPDKDPQVLGPPANDGETPRQDAEGGRISKKRLRRERLILALLEQPTFAKAVACSGMSYATGWRISKTQEFQEEFLAARRQLVSQGSARLQKAYGAAISKTMKLMLDPGVPPGVQLRAAESIMEHAESALQAEDIDLRLKRLEPQKKGKARKSK
jgi:hypothetical protein